MLIYSRSTSQLSLKLSYQECAIYCKVWSGTIKEPVYARFQCKEESSKSDIIINGVMVNND
jgi:hypothetical protein